MMLRRTLLAAGSASIGLAAHSLGGKPPVIAPARAATQTPPVSTAGASVLLTFQDGQYVFSASNGTELDAYHDPGRAFVQRCIVCTNPAVPSFRAFYRPDADGSREEWVFEYGDPWAATIGNLHAYTAVIMRANGSTETVSVPAHYWFSRWRWQSARRPVRRTAADLMAANLIPHFDPAGLSSGVLPTIATYTPMALCGLPADQGQTGDYPGIGIITGWQAQYLTRNGPETLWRNHAEASGTMQWHVRDTKTGAPLDGLAYPNKTITSTNINRPDTGHFPSVAYVPFLLTGDPYYLEELQFAAECMTRGQSHFWPVGRYYAWPLRGVGQALFATPAVVPSWLLPRSHFESLLDVGRACAEARMVNTTDPWCYFFHSMPDAGQSTQQDPVPSGDHVWQHAFVSLVAAWLASAGRAEWRPFAEWSIRSEIDRTSATSGYARSHPAPYHLRMCNASVLASPLVPGAMNLTLVYGDNFKSGEVVSIGSGTMTLGKSSDGVNWTLAARSAPDGNYGAGTPILGRRFTSWQETMESNRRNYPTRWPPADWNNDVLWDPDLTYGAYHRAALAQAVHAGLRVSGLADSFAWLDGQIRARTQAHPIRENWSVVA